MAGGYPPAGNGKREDIAHAWFDRDQTVHAASGWDITGDDPAARATLAEPWMTDHGVYAAGTPPLARGSKNSAPTNRSTRDCAFRARRLALTADAGATTIELAGPDGEATLETDAAARVLLLWGRRPAGPDTLGRPRRLLSGY